MALCEKTPSFFKICRFDKIKCTQNTKNVDILCATELFLSVKNCTISKLPKVNYSQIHLRLVLPELVKLSRGTWPFFLTHSPRFKKLYHLVSNSKSKRSIILVQTGAGKTWHSRTWKPQTVRRLKILLLQLQFIIVKLFACFWGFWMLRDSDISVNQCQWLFGITTRGFS